MVNLAIKVIYKEKSHQTQFQPISTHINTHIHIQIKKKKSLLSFLKHINISYQGDNTMREILLSF